MKTNRADIEFYREMMDHFQEESASKSAQVRAMQDEIAALRRENSVAKESHSEDMERLRQSHSEDMERLRQSHSEDMENLRKSHAEEMEKMRLSFERRLDRMAEANAGLASQLGDALASGKLARARKYARSFFDSDPQTLELLISCDGYNAYRLFDSDEYPGVTVVGCWTHARRNFIDALPSCRKTCGEMISMTGGLFENEAVCAELGFTEDNRLAYRKKNTKPLLDTIKAAADRMWNDPGLMAVGLLKKAVGYLRNQWDHLSNILKSGVPEISNNLSEQRVKPIKLSLKNCLNIGSEEAAKKHAFMHSLAESSRLCSVNIADYFTSLFRHARSTLSSDDLRGLLPNHYT